jgi:hypothetical protein
MQLRERLLPSPGADQSPRKRHPPMGRVKRIEPMRQKNFALRLGWVAGVGQNIAVVISALRRAGVCPDRRAPGFKRLVPIMIQHQNDCEPAETQRRSGFKLDSPTGQSEREFRRLPPFRLAPQPSEAALHRIGLPSIGRGVFGIELDGPVEKLSGGERIRFGDAKLQLAAPQAEVVGVETGGRAAPRSAGRFSLYLDDEMRWQALDQFFLQRHQIAKRPVEALGP